MEQNKVVGFSVLRKESLDKVSGQILYGRDAVSVRHLYGSVKTSPHAFARILSIDKSKAESMPGVYKILTGEDFSMNFGLYLGDKAPIARGLVRHHGEVVAAVVADTMEQAQRAAEAVDVMYEPLKPILTPSDAMKKEAPLLHPDMGTYAHIPPIHPEPGTNIANRTRIRKGDVVSALETAETVIESSVVIPCGDHVAMEPRMALAEIKGTGEVVITSTTQAPFVVKGLMSAFFDLDPGKIVVHAPPLGGGFGGKAGIQLEGLAYLLSRSVGGRPVMLSNTRENDLLSSPGHIGLEASVKLAVDQAHRFTAMDIEFLFNSGAFADYAVNISRAAAISCTGPYAVSNVRCDSLCVYTNMPFATAYRGFGHIEMGYAVERAIDVMADKLGVCPYELRRKNGIREGDTTPVQSKLFAGTGDIVKCFDQVRDMLGGGVGEVKSLGGGLVRAKGIAGLWKAPAMPTNTDAGTVITFNSDGSCNIHTGIVEIGQGTKTGLAQIASEMLGLPLEKIHFELPVNTRTAPSDWATAASRGLMMAGIAVQEACEDAMNQIRETASQVLRVPIRDLLVKGERVYVEGEPHRGLSLSEVVLGYVYPNGNAICGQVIGRGRYIAKNLTDIDPETGAGHPDLEWTLGAEGVEIELDKRTGKFKVLKAVCCIDVGKVINPQMARGQIVGGMAMGISYTVMEGFKLNGRGQVENDTLRDYKIMRSSDAPQYEVRFLETPQQDGPYGARGLGEQSVIGMPGAVSNAISRAIGKDMNSIPITPQKVWERITEVHNESV